MELPTKIIPLNNADEAILHSGQIGTIRLSSGSGMVSYSPCRGGAAQTATFPFRPVYIKKTAFWLPDYINSVRLTLNSYHRRYLRS